VERQSLFVQEKGSLTTVMSNPQPLVLNKAPVTPPVKPIKRSPEDYDAFVNGLEIAKKDLPSIISGEYFQVTALDGKKIKAVCMLCTKLSVISATMDATSNLLRHLKVILSIRISYHVSSRGGRLPCDLRTYFTGRFTIHNISF
jgi:hypothetical protein